VDPDGDRDVDILSGADGGYGARIAWYENTNGKGTFVFRREIAKEYRGSVYPADGDVDAVWAQRRRFA
jgi:hypothetical protein